MAKNPVSPAIGFAPRVQPYSPPVTPVAPQAPAAEVGRASDFEAFTYRIPQPSNAQVYPIYKTHRRWRAIDVFVNTDIAVMLAGTIISVFVYAIAAQGARTLVASGRLGNVAGGFYGGANMQFGVAPTWVAAARTEAQQFEIEASIIWNPNSGQSALLSELDITIMATDEAVDAPPLLGMIGAQSVVDGLGFPGFTTNALFATGDPSVYRPELVGVQASIDEDVTSARWLHFYDMPVLASLPANSTPLMSWPLGPAAGYGVTDWNVRWRCLPPSGNQLGRGIVLLGSSTAAKTTVATDVTIQGFYR